MAPISKPSTATWTRKPSGLVDYRCGSIPNSDGNSSNYSSGEENPRFDRKSIPSFMLNDDMNGRSYVDPWDMENYSFLRRQLEDVNISDNETPGTAAFESAHSDFYYVPLDNNGLPQYQYKHYVDSGAHRDGVSTQFTSLRSDSFGPVPNIDEHNFYNEHIDTPHHSLLSGDSYLEMSNPSRQSERSRYNNQDYQTYMPPSIMKETHEPYGLEYPRYFSEVNLSSRALDDQYGFSGYLPRRRKNVEFELDGIKTKADSKTTLNRRMSFHEFSSDPDHGKHLRRRKSVLDHPQSDDHRPMYDIGVPDYRPKEGLMRRKSIHEIATGMTRMGKKIISQRIPRKSDNHEKAKDKLEVVTSTLPRPQLAPVPETSLVYVYETRNHRRRMSKGGPEMRSNYLPYEDGFSTEPIENFINQPVSRYTMSNYGHLKIDYSCSWNCLDKYIAHRIRT